MSDAGPRATSRRTPFSLAGALLVVAGIAIGIALVATLAWSLGTLGGRPLDGVEGDVFFEALRLRTKRVLYTDPIVGVTDYGAPPSRYLVLYPPVWAAILSLVPTSDGAIPTVAARILACVAWFGGLALVAWRSQHRLLACAAAIFVASTWVLALYGASGRPDALAVGLVAVAIARAIRRNGVDALAGALFALAAWVKPNLVGAAPGALVVTFFVARRSFAKAVVAGVATSGIVAGILTAVSGRVWLDHLLASTAQPPSLSLLREQIVGRLPFFALLFAVAAGAGIVTLRREASVARGGGIRVALGALVSSVAWALLCLAKIGSASNYFMEPSVVAVAVLGAAGLPSLGGRWRVVLASVLVVQAFWNGMASVHGAIRGLTASRARAGLLARARAICGVGEDAVVLADEPGIELMLDGRLVQTPFQTTHLVRRGRFPRSFWLDDVRDPRVTCLVMQDDLLERPLADVRIEHDRFDPELRRALAARFVLAAEEADLRIYRLR